MSRADSLSLAALTVTAVVLYVVGVWLHFPYGGGHVYSDLVTVFQVRECSAFPCSVPVPYVHAFVEYPVITAFFMYAMGALGSALPGNPLNNYYDATWLALLVPTLLLIRELYLIARLRGVKTGRVLWFYVATPTFLVMVLLSWYIIGTFFAAAGIRQFLLGRRRAAGALMGVSAASNLVTAVPVVGLMLSERRFRDAAWVGGLGAAVYGAINLPVYLLNPANWVAFWTYQFNWYIEGSWLEAFFFSNIYSPLRHDASTSVFIVTFSLVLALRFKLKERDPVRLAFLTTFAFFFSTYVYTPQMNVLLLIFFVMLPIPSGYPEFLAYDLVNAAVIVVGFSQILQPLGITYQVTQFGLYSPNQWLAIIRSLWVGKFFFYDGIAKPYFLKKELVKEPSPTANKLSGAAASNRRAA